MKSEIAKAFGNSTRVRILACLNNGQKNVSELISNCNLSQSAVSQHLSKLKELGLVRCKKVGRAQYYELAEPKAGQISQNIIKFIDRLRDENRISKKK